MAVGKNLATSSLRSQDEASFTIISLIFLRI
uniref:Putative S-phase-specific ribosomal protein n=1 Tax=Arabidopsis thaliana TaxID=3702 RepID=Q8H196_ARATH|nr:Putative S-phase-specific ribosomal protein [Arabidopsis thaliana]